MRRLPVAPLLALLVAAGSVAVNAPAAGAAGSLALRAVSTRADAVTGGDVTVAVLGRPGGTRPTPSTIQLTLPAGATSDGFHAGRGGRTITLVSGLPLGPSTLKASAGGATATLRVVNHPITGPVFSGPHQTLGACSTEQVGLGPATDADCSAPTKVTWRYKSSTGTLQPLADPKQLPADAATTTVQGKTVPFVVRVEQGVIDRYPYWIATLDPDATTGASTWSGAGWNGRLVYTFGGGCGTSYSQGTVTSLGNDVVQPDLLARGYALATATSNIFQNSCNDVLSAETVMMVKEHFAEQYAVPDLTIGTGASGGAIQQLMIAQNYPGLLDAINPIIPFPDAMTTAAGVVDCGLLARYYRTPGGAGLTPAQQQAINGHGSPATCDLWVRSFLVGIDPYTGCDTRIPASEIFSDTNPNGLRCTLQDYAKNLFLEDPTTGYAGRPVENLGVQYGLDALKAKEISVQQFLDLNAAVGGYDINGKWQAARMVASPADVRHAYATGRVLSGGGTLRRMPIVMVNLYSDTAGDIHDRVRLFMIRARLDRANGGQSPNAVIWTVPSNGDLVAALTGRAFDPAQIVALLDRWATSGRQPKTAIDTCTLRDGTVLRGAKVNERGPCTREYPVHDDPRTAAGAPATNDVIKCRLKPVNPASYGVTLTSAQVTQLRQIFPKGVCAWNQRGVGQVPMRGTWLDYADRAKVVPLAVASRG